MSQLLTASHRGVERAQRRGAGPWAAGMSPRERSGGNSQALAPLRPLSGRLVDKMPLVRIVSAKLSAVFILFLLRRKETWGQPSISLRILASAPRFLINVILIGFRSLEKTK